MFSARIRSALLCGNEKTETKFEITDSDTKKQFDDFQAKEEFAEKAKDKVEDIVEEVKDLPKKVTRKKPGRAAKKK